MYVEYLSLQKQRCGSIHMMSFLIFSHEEDTFKSLKILAFLRRLNSLFSISETMLFLFRLFLLWLMPLMKMHHAQMKIVNPKPTFYLESSPSSFQKSLLLVTGKNLFQILFMMIKPIQETFQVFRN